MTAYFDRMSRRANDLLKPDVNDFFTAAEALEREIVHDVSLASMMEGCPQDIVEAIDKVILQHADMAQPYRQIGSGDAVQFKQRQYPGRELESNEDVVRRLTCLSEDLHTVFHDLAGRGLSNFSDNPLKAVRHLTALAEERRERLFEKEVAEQVGYWIIARRDGECITTGLVDSKTRPTSEDLLSYERALYHDPVIAAATDLQCIVYAGPYTTEDEALTALGRVTEEGLRACLKP